MMYAEPSIPHFTTLQLKDELVSSHYIHFFIFLSRLIDFDAKSITDYLDR